MDFTFEGGEREIYHGMTVNISETGLCFYTICEAEVGDKIIIQSIKGIQSVAASIRWVKRVDSIFRVGVEYIALQPA